MECRPMRFKDFIEITNKKRKRKSYFERDKDVNLNNEFWDQEYGFIDNNRTLMLSEDRRRSNSIRFKTQGSDDNTIFLHYIKRLQP